MVILQVFCINYIRYKPTLLYIQTRENAPLSCLNLFVYLPSYVTQLSYQFVLSSDRFSS